jgi:hypothetical protein
MLHCHTFLDPTVTANMDILRLEIQGEMTHSSPRCWIAKARREDLKT